MKKKRIIISMVVVICVLVGVFFIIRFGVLGRIYDDTMGRIYDTIVHYVIQNKAEGEGPEELKYETFLDKDGNEVVVEMKKVVVEDKEGNEVEGWVDTAADKAEELTIYDHIYKGKIEKIEDNKIYFIVDREKKEGSFFIFKNVKDYQIIFDIDTYDLEEDPHVGYEVCDSLEVESEDYWSVSECFYSADELEFIVGKYLRVQDCMFEDYYTKDRYKGLIFYQY